MLRTTLFIRQIPAKRRYPAHSKYSVNISPSGCMVSSLKNRIIMETKKSSIMSYSVLSLPWFEINTFLSPAISIHGWNSINSYTYSILNVLKDRLYVFFVGPLLHHTSQFSGTETPVVGGRKDMSTNHFPILYPNYCVSKRKSSTSILGEGKLVLNIYQKAFTTLAKTKNSIILQSSGSSVYSMLVNTE